MNRCYYACFRMFSVTLPRQSVQAGSGLVHHFSLSSVIRIGKPQVVSLFSSIQKSTKILHELILLQPKLENYWQLYYVISLSLLWPSATILPTVVASHHCAIPQNTAISLLRRLSPPCPSVVGGKPGLVRSPKLCTPLHRKHLWMPDPPLQRNERPQVEPLEHSHRICTLLLP